MPRRHQAVPWYADVPFLAGMHFAALAYEYGCEIGAPGHRDTGNVRDAKNNTELVLNGAEGLL